MMERCPVCKARLSEVVVCPRCQADLSQVFANTQQAEFWLIQAQQFWMLHEVPMAIAALAKSLRCEQTPLALAFRDFICQRQYPRVLSYLAQRQITEAEQLLDVLDMLNSHQELGKQLRAFCRYLRLQHGHSSEYICVP